MRSNPTHSELRTACGFTLLEVTISLAVLAIGMLSLMAMQVHAMRGGSSGRHTTEASSIAQSRMEALQRLNWTTLATTGGWTAPVSANVVTQSSTNGVQAYDVSWRIADLVVGLSRTIDVQVTWSEPKRPNRVLTLSSVRFNREGL